MDNKVKTKDIFSNVDMGKINKQILEKAKGTNSESETHKQNIGFKQENKLTESKEILWFDDKPIQSSKSNVINKNITEATIVSTKPFFLNTETLSNDVKENHLKLYQNYAESFNKISSKLDTVPKEEANNPSNSDFRRLKMDEQENLNGVKLHELYFANVGDKTSLIRRDSMPFMRLERDWGSFENWQLDFRACGMSATEGWAVCFFEPFKQKYFNVIIEKHNINIPVGAIPVLVVDTWHHAWFKDYLGEKQTYLNAMMKEINWDIIEARMTIAESSNLHQLYMIQPKYSVEEPKNFTLIPAEAPIKPQSHSFNNTSGLNVNPPSNLVTPKG